MWVSTAHHGEGPSRSLACGDEQMTSSRRTTRSNWASGLPESAVAQDTFWGGWRFATASAVSQLWATSTGAIGRRGVTVETCAARASCAIAAAHGANCVGWRTGCTDDALVLKCCTQAGMRCRLGSRGSSASARRPTAARACRVLRPYTHNHSAVLLQIILLLTAAVLAVCAALLSLDSAFRRSSRSRGTG